MPAIFESVLDIWLTWAVALALLAFCCRRVISRASFANLKRFQACEEGASYALPYVLTFPIFVLLMAVFIQASLILICKMGTVYSAYSAARTYIVWQSAETEVNVGPIKFADAKFRVLRAATMAMVPFASSNPRHLSNMYPGFPFTLGSDSGDGGTVLAHAGIALLVEVDQPFYKKMYDRLLADANAHDTGTVHKVITDRQQGAHNEYILNKFKFAVAATRVNYINEDSLIKWNQDVEIKIRYRMPFHVPGTARILGGQSMRPWWFFGPSTFYRDIESTVKMPSEAAKTPNGRIGIPYKPSMIMELLN